MNRDPVPSIDICLGDLLREEQRLSTQIGMTSERAFSEAVNVAYAAQGRGRNKLQCFNYKEFGHIARNCLKKVCNYCKKEGHLIKDCTVRPQNHQSRAFQAAVQPSSSSALPTVSSDSSVLTSAMVQQIIVSGFSALGLQGTDLTSISSWIVDSGASNHMTGSTMGLHDVCKYGGTQTIQNVDGSTFPITVVGTLGSSF